MTIAYLGIGGNLGDVASVMQAAIAELDRAGGIEVRRVSSLYCSPPWGDADQPDYLNAVIEIRTSLCANDLHQVMQKIEVASGRDRRNERRWGPRSLDLDLLVFGDLRIDTAALTVPHPRMTERPFVMVPLLELNPHIAIPGEKQPLNSSLPSDGLRRIGTVYPNVELFSGIG